MTHVIRILALGSGHPTPFAGLYVAHYDPDALDGRGHVGTTPDPADALHFPSAAEAWELWRMPSAVQPTRLDGKPNRPMTAYTVSVEPLP